MLGIAPWSKHWSFEGFIAPCILLEQPWFETCYPLDVWCLYDLNTNRVFDTEVPNCPLCPTKAPAAVCLLSCLGLLVSFSGFKVLNFDPFFMIRCGIHSPVKVHAKHICLAWRFVFSAGCNQFLEDRNPFLSDNPACIPPTHLASHCSRTLPSMQSIGSFVLD